MADDDAFEFAAPSDGVIDSRTLILPESRPRTQFPRPSREGAHCSEDQGRFWRRLNQSSSEGFTSSHSTSESNSSLNSHDALSWRQNRGFSNNAFPFKSRTRGTSSYGRFNSGERSTSVSVEAVSNAFASKKFTKNAPSTSRVTSEGRSADNNAVSRQRHFGYKYLEELSHKEPHEIIIEMTKKRAPFDTYLEKSEMDPDWLFLILNIIRTVCHSDFRGNRCEILDKLCNSQFLTIVGNYLGDVGLERKKATVKNLPSFVENLCEFYQCLIDTMPSMAVEKDLKKMIMKTKIAVDVINRLQQSVNIDEAVTVRLDVLEARFDDHLKVVKERLPREKTQSYLERIADCAPPENFRELSLYPTYEDIARKRLGFVRPNKISGSYDSVEHYLDVQFRLLREDFIDPLRNGLQKYGQQKQETGKTSKFKYDNVRFYPNTHFVQMKNSKSHRLGTLVNFDPNRKMSYMKWDRSKRFMVGSLLLFTADDFRSFFFGTVLERDLNDLMTGTVLITLAENVVVDRSFFRGHQFLMAESEVFFHPYYLVMKLLKEFDESSFPMKQYIVHGRSIVGNPSYLAESNKWYVDGIMVDLLDEEGWPTPYRFGLDIFQYRAFKAALTQDFCVIQGPPGTGKTFLGLKIVATILTNAKSYSDRLAPSTIKLPILVVCYTNHALDQFLEGILEYTKNIIRVGGQSRSEIMQKYNLRGHNNLIYARRSAISKSTYEAKEEIRDIRSEISYIGLARKSLHTPIGILSVRLISQVVPEHLRFHFKKEENLQAWLLQGNKDDLHVDYNFDDFEFAEEALMPMENPEFLESNEDADDMFIVDEDDIFSYDRHVPSGDFKINYSVTVEKLQEECHKLIDSYNKLKGSEMFYEFGWSLKQEIDSKVHQCYELKKNLEIQRVCHSSEIEYWLGRNLMKLPSKYRWAIYWSWVFDLEEYLTQQLEDVERRYRIKMTQYEEFKQLEDLDVVKDADVVGMTTTGAAGMNLMLKSLKPAVVIVEEAAEVLEAHIVTSLTNECQHVILIGDHEQLRPSTAVYELSKNYNINVSLFERMINNGLNCPVLNVQHRMRPEISCLITPLIYPDLVDHESVLKFESVRGIEKNVFFLDHDKPEQVNDDTATKQNLHEAKFAIRLARYLILQGYQSEKITILTTYTGQMFLLRDLQKEQLAQYVKCIVVDKYQGEENDIIILSLVRSNDEGKIGFLGIKNRVCVALSRARKGFYIIGNMVCLTKNSELWQNIKKTLLQNDAIGNTLQLRCKIHDKSTCVASAEDFKLVMEGGCDMYCKELIACGHYCPSLCHPTNREHEKTQCREPCKNTCPRSHPCRFQCYLECPPCSVLVEFILPCKHTKLLPCHTNESEYECNELVDDVSPLCNHAVKRKCHQKAEVARCEFPCKDRLDCGHVCTRKCHKQDDPDHVEFKCDKPCERLNKFCSEAHVCQKRCHEDCGTCTRVEDRILPCGHSKRVACSADLTTEECHNKCEKVCPQCKTKCTKFCREDCGPCRTEVKKVIPECGHRISIMCSMEPERKLCRQKCKSTAPCGHKCRSMCCKPCGSEKCLEFVVSSAVKPLCGHEYVYVSCCKKNEVDVMKPESFLYYCQEPCNAILECEHLCAGNCGQCWQGRLHWTCKKNCGNTLICGHSCKSPCNRLCPPCDEPCNFRCQHSRCPRNCGVPCVVCKERCEWRCKHSECTRKCGEICNRDPCQKPCERKIPSCGHDCIGFCGEPCPPLCRICNPEVRDIIFGYEDEPDARFVLLVDCNHTIESKALDQHLSSAPEGDEIVIKVCPLCKTPITKTLRYMNQVKETFNHILNVKIKIFGNWHEMEGKTKALANKFHHLMKTDLTFFSEIPDLLSFLQYCHVKLSKSSKKKPLSLHQFSTLSFIFDVLDSIISRKKDFKKYQVVTFEPVLPEVGRRAASRLKSKAEISKKIDFVDKGRLFEFLENFIVKLEKTQFCINRQRMLDFGDELRRYHAMMNYAKLRAGPEYEACKNKEEICSLCASIEKKIFTFTKFTDDTAAEVKTLMEEFRTELKSAEILRPDERRMINEAMSKSFGRLTAGHWYTCPKGHYYCITECGTARQTATCPECNEIIGAGSTYKDFLTSLLS